MRTFLVWLAMLVLLVPASPAVDPQDVPTNSGEQAETLSDIPRVRIDFFFEHGCEDCARVRREVLPILEASLAGFYDLHEWDVGDEESYRRLLGLLEQTGVSLSANATVHMFVDGSQALVGVEDIVANLLPTVETTVAKQLEATGPSQTPVAEPEAVGEQEVTRLARTFTVWGVAMAGLVDGINPCAIATLVFLISVLSMSSVVGVSLLRIGLAFCAGSFMTYFVIGLGLLRALETLAAFQSVQHVFDAVFVATLLLLAAYSFLDAFRFRRSHRASDVSIQLPASVKNRVHRLLRIGLGKNGTMLSAFVIAIAVTALESVCTGQVYLPTLAYIVRSGNAVGRGMALLTVYNLMFISPLVVVLVLVHEGLRLQRLMAWSAKEVFFGKLAMGLFFVVMAILIVLL